MEQIPNLSGLEVGDNINFMLGADILRGNLSPNRAIVEYVFRAVPYCTIVDILEEDGRKTRVDFFEKADNKAIPPSGNVVTFLDAKLHRGLVSNDDHQVIHLWKD